MRAHLIAVGERMPAWVQQGFAEYAKRLSRELPLDLVEVCAKSRDPARAMFEAGESSEDVVGRDGRKIFEQLEDARHRPAVDFHDLEPGVAPAIPRRVRNTRRGGICIVPWPAFGALGVGQQIMVFRHFGVQKDVDPALMLDMRRLALDIVFGLPPLRSLATLIPSSHLLDGGLDRRCACISITTQVAIVRCRLGQLGEPGCSQMVGEPESPFVEARKEAVDVDTRMESEAMAE